MKRRVCWIALLIVVLFAPAAFAGANFSQVVTFGDSLTNNDLIWITTGKSPDLYGNDPMEAVFVKGGGVGSKLTSYAVAGTESSYLQYEVGAYFANRAAGKQAKATLFCIEMGGNDVLNNIGLLASAPPGASGAADGVIQEIMDSINEGWTQLRQFHSNAQFVFWTIPDVTLIPKHWGEYTGTEQANIRAHLKRVNRYIKSLESFQNVVVLDLYQITQTFVSTPYYVNGHQLVPPPVHGDYDDLFADEIHPTAVTNAILANRIIKRMNVRWSDAIPLYTKRQLARLAHF
ncbi:MAG: SGNH/GDSL hydrolase family protein [Acidobacteriota bacterium]